MLKFCYRRLQEEQAELERTLREEHAAEKTALLQQHAEALAVRHSVGFENRACDCQGVRRCITVRLSV